MVCMLIILQIVGSLVELYGSLSFIGNSVGDVAALHLLSLAQIRITSGLTMEFVENNGRYTLEPIQFCMYRLASFSIFKYLTSLINC